MSFWQRYKFWRYECEHGFFRSIRLAIEIKKEMTYKFWKFHILRKPKS